MPKEAFYFSHDSNARNDEKIVLLRMKHGWEGYGLFWAIIERLRECSDYMSVCDYNLIAYDLRVDSAKIKSIICDFGLFAFTEDGKCFYSNSLMERMKIKEEQSNRAKNAALIRWELERKKSVSNTDAMQMHSGGNAIKEKKGNKRNKILVGDKSPALKIEERKISFGKSLQEFKDKYPRDMLTAFYNYWTESNRTKTKMKFELEKTFETNLRLATWASRDKNFKPEPKTPERNEWQETIERQRAKLANG